MMGKFEEQSKNRKKECLDNYVEESESIRVLGPWVGMKEDVNVRVGRTGGR